MKEKLLYLINIQSLLFISFLVLTSYFNRFAIDDYHFIGQLKTASFNEIYSHLYYQWHGRWTSNFLLLSFLKLNQLPYFLTFFNLISFGLLYIGVARLFNSINIFYQLQFQNRTILTYAVIFIGVLFFCTITPNDTWFWFTSSVVYFWSTIAFFFAFSLFFIKTKKWFDYLIFVLSVLYIGGANEPLTFFIIVACLLLILKKKEIFISGLGLAVIISAFLINFLSDGTTHRDLITPNLSVINLVLYTGYSVIKFLFFSIHKTFIPALFLGISFYLLGKKINSLNLVENFRPLKDFFWSILLIIVTVIMNQLLVVYALGGLSPDRAGIASSVVIALILVRYLFLLGNYHQQKHEVVKYLIVGNVIGLVFLNIFYFGVHQQYAKAVDERIKLILKNDASTIVVEPLPNSGYLYSAEITTDTTNFKNTHLKEGLGLKNNVVLKN
ncbi:MAG: hypothetical protein CO118_00930 [Flavobacteriales bacterium CG_4_9_14_3_um_filter_32_8]|nr:MAG: hypothetical protein CO118_00930 [Flavobacteriales bacterium CG_4_9_14_3_um_filter_32_8]